MSLRRAIVGGEGWAVALTLKTLGKDDGYVERVQNEVTGADGGPVQTEIVIRYANADDNPDAA